MPHFAGSEPRSRPVSSHHGREGSTPLPQTAVYASRRHPPATNRPTHARGRAVRPARYARSWITTDYIHPRTFVSAWVGDTSDHRDWPPTAHAAGAWPGWAHCAPRPNGQSAGPDTLAQSSLRGDGRPAGPNEDWRCGPRKTHWADLASRRDHGPLLVKRRNRIDRRP